MVVYSRMEGWFRLLGPLVHPGDEGPLAARQVLGQGHGAVVARDYGNAFNHLGHGHLFPLLQVDLGAAHAGGVGGDGDRVVFGQLAGVHRLHHQQKGHDLGDAGWFQLFMGVFLQEESARLLFHQNGGGAGEIQAGLRRGRGSGLGNGGGKHEYGQQ